MLSRAQAAVVANRTIARLEDDADTRRGTGAPVALVDADGRLVIRDGQVEDTVIASRTTQGVRLAVCQWYADAIS